LEDRHEDLFTEVIGAIKPLLTQDRRRGLLQAAFTGESGEKVLNSIDFTGANDTFAPYLVRHLVLFGEVERGRPALIVLLESLGAVLGVNRRDYFNDLNARLSEYLPLDPLRLHEIVRERPRPFASAIENFISYYLGSPSEPEPFGGRDQALAALTGWLDGPGEPYLLLTAPAGRGKSALLVHWIDRLGRDPDGPGVVFVPMSIRYRLNTSHQVFGALVARLADAYGDEPPRLAGDGMDELRDRFSGYLRCAPPGGRVLLVVLDGLDEAAGWSAGPELFPARPAGRVKLLASARWTSDRPDEAAWRRQLGWDRAGMARGMTLAPLDRAETQDVLRSMGVPLDILAAREYVVSRLLEVTGGDPLLLNLYVKDLWGQRDHAATLDVADLDRLRPGIEGYFDRWWEDQQVLWGENFARKGPKVRAVFDLLAVAFGPLSRADLLTLAGNDEINGDDLDDALDVLRRFVIARPDRRSFVLAHPRFAIYRYERLKADGEHTAFETKFLDWGRATLRSLTSNRPPTNASPYIIQFYGAHLYRAGARPDDLLAMVNESWRQAWDNVSDDFGGFLGDVSRALAAARASDRQALSAGRAAPCLAGQVRCALALSANASFTQSVGSEMLAALLAHGIWSGNRAIRFLAQLESEYDRAAVLRAIAPHLPREVIPAAFQELGRIAVDRDVYAPALAAVCRRVAALGDLARAVATVESQAPGYTRGFARIELHDLLPIDDRPEALAAILDDVEAAAEDSRRDLALLAEKLTGTVQRPVAPVVGRETCAPDLVLRLIAAVAREPLPNAATLGEIDPRELAVLLDQRLEYVAGWIDGPLLSSLIRLQLEQYRDYTHFFEFRILDLARFVEGDLLADVIAMTGTFEDEDYRVAILAALWPAMSVEQRAAVLPTLINGISEGLQLSAIDEQKNFIANLGRDALGDAAIDAMENRDPENWYSHDLWAALAPFLDERQVRRALRLVPQMRREIRDQGKAALCGRLAAFGHAQAREALAALSSVDTNEEESLTRSFLETLASITAGTATRGAFHAPTQLSDPVLRLEALRLVAAEVGALTAEEFADAAWSFESTEPRVNQLMVEAIGALAPFLKPDAVLDGSVGEVVEFGVLRIGHSRKAMYLSPYFRRLAEVAGAQKALEFGRRLARASFDFPIVCSIVGAAEFLNDDLLDEAFRAAWLLDDQTIHDVALRALALSAVLPRREASHREEEWQQVLDRIDHTVLHLSYSTIGFMFKLLPDDLREISAKHIFTYFDTQFLTSDKYYDENRWSEVVESLCPYFTEAMAERYLHRAYDLGSAQARSRAVAALAPRLAEFGRAEEALDVIGSQLSYGDLLTPLKSILPHLPGDALLTAINIAINKLDAHQRVALWGALRPHWSEFEAEVQVSVLELWVDRAPKMTRKDVILDLLGFARLVATLGEPGVIRALSKVVRGEPPGP
jgi:hypothetical protein